MFVALARRELLEKCIRGATQNTNECFHNVIWSIASKTHFIAKSTLNTAVHLAAARYNSGHAVGLQKCLEATTGREATSRAIASFKAMDQDRITYSVRRASETQKERRSFLALQRSRQEELSIATYGVRYGPGLDEEDEHEEEL